MTDVARASPRRILIVQYSSSRDGSTFSGLLLADGLRDAGWETHVAFGHEGPMQSDYAERGHVVHVVAHDNWLRRRHPLRFIKDCSIEYRRSREFSALIRSVSPSVVYVNTTVSMSAVVAAKRENIPVVWHLRELFDDVGGEMKAPRLAVPLVRRLIVRYADRLVSPARAIADNLLGVHARCVSIVPNAVEESFFMSDLSTTDARKRFELPRDAPIIGVPGMLRPMKGHVFFFEAVASSLLQRPKLRILVSGSGDPRFEQKLRLLVQTLGIDRNVVFTGVVEDMIAFYLSCDMICIPSEAEPFGRTVIEAMACRRAVVATSVGGIPEIIEHGATGLLVEYGEHDALANTLLELLDDSGERKRLGEQAVRAARKRFHVRAYQTSLNALVERLVASGSGGELIS